MTKKQDKNTRYYIDLDLKNRKILNWDYAQRDKLAKGQYNKLDSSSP